MSNRILPLILSALLLTACGTETVTTSSTETQSSISSDSEAVTEIETTVPFLVPDTLDFGKAPFHVLACEENVRYTYLEDPEQTGDIMDDAIYQRNLMTEDYLNIDLNVVKNDGTNLLPKLKQDVMSGDCFFDMISPHILNSIGAMVVNSYLMPLDELPHVDFSKPWWNQGFTETLQIGNHLYYASGDMIAPNARVIVFNKQMMNDLDLPDIYEDVRSGKWTLDRLGFYVKDIIRDLDGSGTLDEKDQYAFSDLANTGLATSFVHASDELFVRKNGDRFDLTLASDKIVTITEKLYDYLYKDGNLKITNEHFGAGQVLFGSQVLLKLQMLRDYPTDFGIIPFPKFDETQEKYHSSVWNSMVSVPSTAKNPEMSGAALETLAYFSQSTLMPAYYEKLLDSKFVRDESSSEMLDLIFDGLVYDIGLCFDDFMGYYSSIGTLLSRKKTDITSYLVKQAPKFQKHYDKITEFIQSSN